jgi:hypothetical protein
MVVETYSKTNLTFQSDKFPALSGVACKIQHLLGYHYVAGLWKKDLARGLASRRVKDPMGPISSIVLSDYRAPSWSWASQEGKIWFNFRSHEIPLEIGDLDILDVNAQLHVRDPFGQIRSGHLKVHGKVRVGTIRKLAGQNSLDEQCGLFICHDCIKVLVIGEYIPDHPSLADTFALFEDLSEKVDEEIVQQKLLYLLRGRRGDCAAMAIEPVQGQLNRYRRIRLATDGLWEGSLRNWFAEFASMTAEII